MCAVFDINCTKLFEKRVYLHLLHILLTTQQKEYANDGVVLKSFSQCQTCKTLLSATSGAAAVCDIFLTTWG